MGKTRSFKSHAVRAVLAASAAIGAIAAPAAADCVDLGAKLAAISKSCETTAASPSLTGFQAGIAYFNAARAYLVAAPADVSPSTEYAKAATLIDQSRSRLPDDAMFSNMKKSQKSQRDAFRFDRALAYATALESIAVATPFIDTSYCYSRQDCLTKALDRVQSDAIAAPFAPSGAIKGDPRYNEFFYRRGSLYAARNEALDADPAIENFKKVLNSARTERKTEARPALEKLAMKLGDENRARGGISISQAIRYYTDALVARPNSAPAQMGLAKSYLQLCKELSAKPVQGPENCVLAAKAFETAGKAQDAVAVDVNLGAGEAYAEAAKAREKLNGSGDANVAIYRQASAAAYRRAASPEGGGSAKAKLEYARAMQAAGSSLAAEAFRDYVGAELVYPGWFAADWQSAVGADFQKKLNAVSGSEARRNIADAMMVMYKTRSASGGIRKDIGLSLLSAALLAQPSLADASLEAGRLHLLSPASLADADRAFMAVISSTGGLNGPASPGREKIRAEAFYQLSKSEAQTATTSALAQTSTAGAKYARDASTLDGAELKYKKAACLALIATYRASSADSANSGWCSGISGADGQLLLGMYYLRVARAAPNSKKSGLLDQAKLAFAQGMGLVPGATAASLPPTFETDWPNAPSPMSIATLLDFGGARADVCKGVANGVTNNVDLRHISKSEIARASSLFSFFQVGSCSG